MSCSTNEKPAISNYIVLIHDGGKSLGIYIPEILK